MNRIFRMILTGLLVLLPLTAIADSGANSNQWSGTGPFATGAGNRVISALAVSPDSRTVYAGSGSGTVSLLTLVLTPPLATTLPADGVGAVTATLNGLVDSFNLGTVVTFEYGLDLQYGATATAASSPVTAAGPNPVSAAIAGLLPVTTYHYRVKAVSSAGEAYGSDLTFTTAKVTTSTVVATSGTPSLFGNPVTFTATVTPAAPGMIQFLDGVTPLGSVALVGGKASISTSALSSGSHSITAVYAGDGSNVGSTSDSLSQQVQITTTTKLSSDVSPSANGQKVTFTATVVTPFAATGTVTFYDGATFLGSAPLAGGKAVFSTALLSGGSHSIMAVYAGDSSNLGSTSVALIQQVQFATTTTLRSDVTPSAFGQKVTLLATVAPATATGTVTFKDGATDLGTVVLAGAGTATFSTATLSSGSHSITAVYAGDSAYNGSTSAPVVQTVQLAAIPATENVRDYLATLILQAGSTGTGYFTLLAGSGTACGTGTQVKAGQSSAGVVAPQYGSLSLTAGIPARYTVSTLQVNSAYTICFTADTPTDQNLQAAPATASFTTTAAMSYDPNVSWWSAENNAKDNRGVNNGTMVGGTYAAGPTGQAFSFDGSQAQYVTVPNNASLDLVGGHTVAFRMKFDAYPVAGKSYYLVNKWAAGAEDKRVSLDANGKLTYYLHGTGVIVTSTASLQRGVWNQVVATYDGAFLKIYINGILDAGISAAGDVADSNGALYFGYNPDRASELNEVNFKGLLDEVMWYNRALTPVEVEQLTGLLIFPPQTGMPRSTLVVAKPITVTGIAGPTASSMTGGEYAVSTDSGVTWGAWTSSAGTVNVNNQVKVRQTSSAGYATLTTATLTIGSVSGDFKVTTAAALDPRAAGLVAWWKGEFNAYDSVGGYHGTLKGGATYAAGRTGEAFSLNGSDASVLTSYNQDALTEYTVSAWIKTTDASSGGGQTIVQNRGAGSGKSLTLGVGKTDVNKTECGVGKVFFALDSDSILIGRCAGGSVINDGLWHHVVGVWSAPAGTAIAATQFRIAIDGVNQTQTLATLAIGSATSPLTGVGGLEIGHHGVWGTYFKGSIDEVEVFNRALLPAEDGTLGKIPDPFSFTAQTGSLQSTLSEATPLTVTGITDSVGVSITGGEYALSSNNGVTWSSWTSTTGTVGINNQIKVRQTSSASYVTMTTATLTMGGVSGAFNVTTLLPPPPTTTVTGISPASGPSAGGTVVTITGAGFTGATAVTFGAVPASDYSVDSDTRITVTSPASTPGTREITVTTAGGTSAFSAGDRFTAIAPPAMVTSFGPVNYAYIPNSLDNTVSVIDTLLNVVVSTINVWGYPAGVVVNPAGTRAYVTNANDNTLSVIDTADNSVAVSIPVGAYPLGITLNHEGTLLFVANQDENSISVIDTGSNNVVTTIPGVVDPRSIAANPADSRIYVTNGSANTVTVIDTVSRTVVNTITVGTVPQGIAVNPTGTRVYVANNLADTVSVIDTVGNTVVATIDVAMPAGVTVNPEGTRVYVTNVALNTVSVIDTATNTVIDTIPVGNHPSAIALNPSGTRLYVTSIGDNTVSVIDTVNNTVTAVIPVGVQPKALGPFVTQGVARMPANGVTTLNYTLFNANTIPLSGVAFTDSLPAGVVVANPTGLTSSCGGVTAIAGSSSVTLAGGALADSSSCSLSLNVTSSAGMKVNSVTVSATEGGTGSVAQASLLVMGPPTLSTAFGAASIPLNGVTTLSFTITNPNDTLALTGVGFSDTLPTGLVIATPSGLTSDCKITFKPGPDISAFILPGVTLEAGQSCTYTLNVIGTTPGTKVNTTGAVTSIEQGAGGTASATIAVVVGPILTSATTASFTETVNGSFTVTATGYPLPTLSVSGSLPSGLVFIDNGNGTATLAGTPAFGTAGGYPLIIYARNTAGTDGQKFGLLVNLARFTLSTVITGNGSVNNGDIACTASPQAGTCSYLYPPGAKVELLAAISNSLFFGWGDACVSCGSALSCVVLLDGPKTCSATFLDPALIIISDTPSRSFISLQSAYAAARSGATIKAQSMLFTGNLLLDIIGRTVTIKGGYEPTFTTQTGVTMVKGTLTIGKGGLVADRVVVR